MPYHVWTIYSLLGLQLIYSNRGEWSKWRQVKTATGQNGYRSKLNV